MPDTSPTAGQERCVSTLHLEIYLALQMHRTPAGPLPYLEGANTVIIQPKLQAQGILLVCIVLSQYNTIQ